MTVTCPTRCSSLSICGSSSRVEDQRLLRRAAAAAILVHCGLLLVPLPASSPPPPPVPTESTILISKTIFDPPEIEPRPPEAVRQTDRREPIPVPVAPDEMFEPSAEPVEPVQAPVTPHAPADPDFILGPVPPPPPSAGPLDENTLGLVLPVAVPGRARPEYPRTGRMARLEGRVVLKAVVDKDGRVVSIRVLSRPAPDPGFSESAVAAVSRWRYTPGEYGGEPVAVEITVIVEFILE